MVLPRSTPLAEGVDPRGVLALLDAIEASGLEFHSLMIARHGRVIAEGWWTPYRPDRVHLGYSLSKSFTATAIGVLVDAGQVGLDDVVLDYFPWIDRAGVDPNWSAVRVRHCLSMTIGHTEDMWLPAEEQQGPAGAGAVPDPFVAAIFALPVPCVPGSVFAYNQVATYLLSAVVREVTGAGLLELLAAAVFQPLGIDDALWVTTPWGLELGFSGIHVTTESILGLAQLYLDNGVAGRQRVLSEAWVAEATRATGAPRAEPGDSGPDWLQGYGFSFWQSRHGYRGDGAYGQFAIVLPEQEMCIAITAEAADMQAQLDLLWEHLLPAIDRTSAAAEDDELADRLARLSLEPLASPGPGPHSGSWPASGVLSDPGNRSETPFSRSVGRVRAGR